jgi:hypothetical protein
MRLFAGFRGLLDVLCLAEPGEMHELLASNPCISPGSAKACGDPRSARKAWLSAPGAASTESHTGRSHLASSSTAQGSGGRQHHYACWSMSVGDRLPGGRARDRS